jgi:1-carboxybiuret hydrolase
MIWASAADIARNVAAGNWRPLLGQRTMMLNGREVPLRPNIGIYTQPISFIGLPVVAVPVPTSTSLPIGVQIIAAPLA